MRRSLTFLLVAALAAACGRAPEADDAVDAGDPPCADAGAAAARPFADRVVTFTPGEGAGFGQDRYPDVVLGAPKGKGAEAGSLDVLSLGREGVIVLAFTDVGLVDGDGPDLLVFENPFSGFFETAAVAVSEDGVDWHEWSCSSENVEEKFPGCAGVASSFSNPSNCLDAADPAVSGGDSFDLADLGLARARFVRVRDTGRNSYAGSSGGFDLDAVAVVNGEALTP